MQRIKTIFDDERLLNPGVLLNDDDRVHLKATKEMAVADDIVDLCIECGFCEPACPSAGLTLSPRQRIAVIREEVRLEASGENNDLLAALRDGYVHAGMDTCAACNLCSTRCPVGIETGTMIIGRRDEKRSGAADAIAGFMAEHTGTIESLMRGGVAAQSLARTLVGDGVVDTVSGALNRFSGHKIPKPNKNLRPGPGAPERPAPSAAPNGRIVYFPACASRMFGPPKTDLDLLPVTGAMLALLARAGYEPVLPDNLNGLCCGQPFQSKGFPDQAQKLGSKLHQALANADPSGTLAAVTDMSTCALHLKADGVAIADSAEFLLEKVVPHLKITRPLPVLAVHHNCSAQRMAEQTATEALARACAKQIAVLKSVTCCGYAGDKGMYQPELNAHALRFARNDIPDDCSIGVSTVSTCATGLSDHLGLPFVALASVLEYVSRP
jgi:D-lactate dehydrogenase